MDITIEMPIEDWNELQHILIESKNFITVVGNTYMKGHADNHIERIKRAVQIIDDVRGNINPHKFVNRTDKTATLEIEEGKIVEVKYD